MTALTFTAILLLIAAVLALLQAVGFPCRVSLGWLGVTVAFVALAVSGVDALLT
jgi:hypothetical protein